MMARPAQYDDVERILDDLSDISKAEMAVLRTTPFDMMRRARHCMKGAGLDAILRDDEPIAVFGAAPMVGEENVLGTWFLASRAFFEHGARSTLFCRKHMAKVADSHPGKEFMAYTASDHPDLDRWFALLGFADQKHLDLVSIYRYCREKREAVGRRCAR